MSSGITRFPSMANNSSPAGLQDTNHLDSDVSEISLRSTLDELIHLRIPRSRLTIMDSSEVGSGRYGEVLLAILDKESQTPTSVAVKELRTVGTRGVRKRVALRLARELKIWAKAEHPHVLRLIGYYLSDNYEIAQLISPFMSNGNVSQYLETLQVGVLKRLDIIRDITLGMDYLHGCDPPICHGDLKPTNILVNDSLQAVLCDFGLASFVEESGISTGLTTSRSIKGSMRYMSPELHSEGEAKHTLESDVWAWACTAFEIVTDCPPYNAVKGDVGILMAFVTKDPPGSTETLMSRLVDETSADAALASQNLPDCLTRCWAFEAKLRPRMPSILHQVFPTSASNMYSLGIERGAGGDDNSGPSFGSAGRNQGRRMSSMGPPGPNRSASMNMDVGLNFPGGKNAPTPFGSMGNFWSTPSGMTSEERFAVSNNRDRAVSGGSAFMRNVPMSRSSGHGGVGGIGGPNAVPPSPREANGIRSQRDRAWNDSLKPSAPQLSQQQLLQQALSGLEPVPALQQSENRWTPAARSKLALDDNSPEYVERKVKGLLNKLTLKNFDSVSNQIISWANKSENEKNGATLILVIKLVIEKATDEARWSEMYARLCRKMMEQISATVQDDNIRNNAGEPIVGGHLFRKYLLKRCQEDFERGWSQKESAQAAAALKAADDKAAAEVASKASGEDDEPVLYSDEYYALLKTKRQGLGLVRFIGELFKLQMLTERIMHECIKKLLSKIDNPEEEEIESLCKLLTTVGQALDTPKAKGHMDIYFGRMQMLADNPHVASRIRYMLLDVIELRGRSWRPRNAAAGPSTIAQVREQDAREKAAAAQQASKMVPMSRTGSQRGGRGAPEQGPDGWNVAGPTPVRAPAKSGDLSNYGKFTANSGPLKTIGPSSVFKKGDRGRDTPPPSTGGSICRATSRSNMYSLLGAGGANAVDAMPKRTPSGRGTTRKPSIDQAPQAPPDTPARRKLNLLPHTVSSAKTYTDKEAKAQVEEEVKEFFNVRDVSEGEKSFAEMPDEHKGKLVDELAFKALYSKEADVNLVADLFEKVAGKSCPPSAFEEGFAGIIEFLDDTATDVPQAYTFMARMLRGSKLPQETVESLADKIFVDGDPLVKPKGKLLKAYAATDTEKLQAPSLFCTASASTVTTPASAWLKLGSTSLVHESKQGKNARKKERKSKGELEAEKRKEVEDKAKKEEEDREARRKAEEAERLQQREGERRKKEAKKKRQEEEEARKRKEEEERLKKEAEERERKEQEERERKEKEERERKEREEAEAKARAGEEEKTRKDAEEAARLAAEAKAKEEAEAPGQMPGQAPYPPQQMPMGWQQPQYGGWQPQYPQYPYMNPEWYYHMQHPHMQHPHMQHPHMHQHPHQPLYMQPPGAPYQPFASPLPPTQQTPTTATMSSGPGPMPTLPLPFSSTPVSYPNVPQNNTSIPPSIPSRPASATSLTPSAREFVPGDMSGPSPMIPPPDFPCQYYG